MRGAITGSADLTIADGAAEIVALDFGGVTFCVMASAVCCSVGGCGGRVTGSVVVVVVVEVIGRGGGEGVGM